MPPVPREPLIDSKGQMSSQWNRWIGQLQRILSFSGGIAWKVLNKGESKLSDIELRTHAMLQSVLGWATGTDTEQSKHISSANGKVWQDHVDIVNGNPHGTDHDMLDEIMVLDISSADTVQDRHLSDSQGKKWEDHVDIVDGNPHGTDHSMLDAIIQANDTSTNTDTGKHVTDAQLKVYKDHTVLTTVHHSAMAAQADSSAIALLTLVGDFNALLAKLRATGRLTP
jgi:hypothetical protein